jgi:hypothetical protein
VPTYPLSRSSAARRDPQPCNKRQPPECSVGCLPMGGCEDPQPPVGEQIARLLLRDPDLNACFQSRPRVHQNVSAAVRSLPHAPLTVPAHSLRYLRNSMGSGDEGVRHRRARMCPLWRPPTPDRHAARSRGHPEDPRAPRPRPLGAESRPRPTQVRRRRALIGSAPRRGGRHRACAARWHSC